MVVLMAAIPAWLLRHQVSIEQLLGEGPTGPVYAAPVDVRCFVDESRRLIRDADGNQVVSEARVFTRRDVACPVGSRVTLPSGRAAVALAVSDRDGGGLPVPDHTEIALT